MLAAVLDLLVGSVFLGLGALLLHSRRCRPVGVLMLATGGAWLLGSVLPAAVFVHRGPMIHLLVSYPVGRPRTRPQRVVVALGYADMVQPVGRNHWASIALAVVVTAVVVATYRRSDGVERRGRTTSATSCVVLMGTLVVGAVARLTGADVDPQLVAVYGCALIGAGAALFGDLRWGRWNRSAIAALVIDLGRSQSPLSVRDKLARAVNDPALQLGFLDPDGAGLVDESGRPLRLAQDGRERTLLWRDGVAFAELAHSPGVLNDPVLRASVTALIGLAVANARLQAAVLGRVAEVAESRRRFLDVTDRERRVLEAQIRSGPETRLEHLTSVLDAADADLMQLLDESRLTLRDFARGMHPRSLVSAGLPGACAELARAAPLPVTVDVPAERLPSEVELALYFVCAEALTNTIKYAAATRAEVRLIGSAGSVRMEVSDDGRGGAVIGAGEGEGSGLQGLTDRLAVIGGSLTVDSPPGRGTTVVAQAPRAAAIR